MADAHAFHRQAVALARDGDWQRAHDLIQTHNDPLACRIHGWLHRVEGDAANADYWYRRARFDGPFGSVEEELRLLEAAVGDAPG